MISIAVQAGGRSSSMGRDKALIPLAGKRLIEHVLERVRDFTDDLFVTTNQSQALEDLQVRLVSDEIPGQGALFGLQTALNAARHDHVLIVACDMPFLQQGLIEHLLSLVGQADVIVPELEGNYEPLLAIYRASACLPAIETSLHEQKYRMISFFPAVKIMPVRPEVIDQYDFRHLSFFNINTPQDVITAEKILLGSPFPASGSLNQPTTNQSGNLPNGES
jgi:molybdopterin-guanine dinucleotide biosynthesis protein A